MECTDGGLIKATLAPSSTKCGSARKTIHTMLEKFCGMRQGVHAQSTPVLSATSPIDTTNTGESGRESDPMVCMPIKPFLIPVMLEAIRRRQCNVLIDSECTCCLMSLQLATDLGVCIKKLAQPIRFEQMDGSLLGGGPATHVTGKLTLEIGQQSKELQFVVVPRITKDIVLEMAWLDKWGPTIWWGGGCRHLRIGLGSNPLPHESVPQSPGTTHCKTGTELDIPKEYIDLAKVFSEKECNVLPPHRPTECWR